MERLSNIHPGDILLKDFLEEMKITPYKLAKDIHVDQMRVHEIINKKRAITAGTALRLSKYFGNSAMFWMNLQTIYDLEEKQLKLNESLNTIELVNH